MSDRTPPRDTTIRPFRINVPQADLDDLCGRLARTHFAALEAPDVLVGEVRGFFRRFR